MQRIPWSPDIGLAPSQICVTLISLIARSRSPTISAAKRLGGQRSRWISLQAESPVLYIHLQCCTQTNAPSGATERRGASSVPGAGCKFPWQHSSTFSPNELLAAGRRSPLFQETGGGNVYDFTGRSAENTRKPCVTICSGSSFLLTRSLFNEITLNS